ncbi:kinase-like domain-containing protein [Schizophyllum commune]
MLGLTFLRWLLSPLFNRIRRLFVPYLLRRGESRYPRLSLSVHRLPAGTVLKRRKAYRLRPEADAMQFLSRQRLPTPIPVPRLVDYWENDEEGYLVMEYIEGERLLRVWRNLSSEQHAHVIRTIAGYVEALRAIPQPLPPSLPSAGWIGSASGGPFTDLAVTWSQVALGPFPSQASFNDWHMSLFDIFARESAKTAARVAEKRREMRDDHPIVFTHGDINMENVLVRVHGEGPEDVEVVALLDWEQSGWRPLYWEAMKWLWLTRRSPVMDAWREFGWKVLSGGYEDDARREFELFEISGTPPDVD